MEAVLNVIDNAIPTLWHWESRLAIVYLCATVLAVHGIWTWRGRPTRFLRFLLPREVSTTSGAF